jgi:hypothetical protein
MPPKSKWLDPTLAKKECSGLSASFFTQHEAATYGTSPHTQICVIGLHKASSNTYILAVVPR